MTPPQRSLRYSIGVSVMALPAAAILLALVVSPTVSASTADVQLHSRSSANPIRKVVTMLQSMQTKVQAEGAREKELFEKYMCWCQEGSGSLGKAIADAEVKVPAVGSDIEQSEAKLAQLKADLKQHRVDRDAAKSAVAEATAVRERQAAAFTKSSSTEKANIAALDGAITAVSKGVAGDFLQTATAQVLRRLVTSKQDIPSDDQQDLLSFLSGSNTYSPQSGQVLGIMKQLRDEMAAGLADEISSENRAIESNKGLMTAKHAEIAALTAAIEKKTVRAGEAGVDIVEMKNDLTDTQEALRADREFLRDLDKNCALKKKDWEERSATRSQELVALSETIKVLNDDDALELFKRTLPSAGASLVQVSASTGSLKA